MNCRGGWGVGSYNRSEMGMRGGWVGRWVDPEMNMEDACVYLILHLFQVLLRQHVALIKCVLETGRLTLLPEEGDDDWLLIFKLQTLQTSVHVTEQTFVMCKILENSFTCAKVLRILPISLWNLVIYLSLKDFGNSRNSLEHVNMACLWISSCGPNTLPLETKYIVWLVLLSTYCYLLLQSI